MLMVVKNEIKVMFLSFKYALTREMLNKVSFISNVLFMILNNLSMIIQWVVLFSIKNVIGNYTFKDVVLLWAFASFSYGISRLFFANAFELSDIITNGELDTYLVQPKNVLIGVLTGNVISSAFGDLLYGIICFIVYGFSIDKFLLFLFLGICGGLCVTAFAVIVGSLSFFIGNASFLADNLNNITVTFAIYPAEIFKKFIQAILYIVLPIGLSAYLPVSLLLSFNIVTLLIVIFGTIGLILLAFLIFGIGLKKYSSTNLMNARI